MHHCHHPINWRQLSMLLVCVIAWPVSMSAQALEFTADLEVSAAYETNALNRTDDQLDNPLFEGDEDTALSYGLNLGFEHRENRWNVGGQYTVNYLDYLEDLNQDETLFTGVSDFVWRVKPGFLEWSFTHQRENERRNVLELDTPDNRETRDVFTTQPVAYWRLGSGDEIITSARYVLVDQETANNNDSQRWGAALGWRRHLSQVSSFSVNGEFSQVDFDQANADYDSYRTFVEYAANLRALDYSVQVGVSHIAPDFDDSFTGEYIRAEGTLRDDVHSYTVALVDEITDTSLALSDVNFALNIDNRATNNVEVFDGANIVTQRQLIFTYQGDVLCGSCSLTASLGYVDLDYETEERDQRNILGSVGLQYDYTQNIAIGVGFDYQDSEIEGADAGFINIAPDSSIQEYTYTAQVEWQLSRRLSTLLSYSHDVQEGPIVPLNGGLFFDPNFDNDIITLAVRYRLW